MKLRQAKKICDNCHLFRDLVCKVVANTEFVEVVGMKTKRYNYRQFQRAFRIMKKHFNRDGRIVKLNVTKE